MEYHLRFGLIRYVLRELFPPLVRRNVVERFEDTGVSALVGKHEAMCDFGNRNVGIGQKRRGITAFTKMDIVRQRLLRVLFELTAYIALIVAYGFDDFWNTHRHVIFSVQICEQVIEPIGIFGFFVNSMFQNCT